MNPGDPDSGAETGDEAPHATAESAVFYTDAGRVVYAQGGITPDVIVKNDRDSKLLQQLLARYAFFNFAVDWLARHPNVAADFDVTPEIRDDFFQFVEKSAKYSTAEELKKAYAEDPNRSLVDLAIKIEVVNAKFGPEAGRRVFVGRRSADPEGPDAVRRGLPHRVAAQEEARDGGQSGEVTVASASRGVCASAHRRTARPMGLDRSPDPSLRCGSRIANLLPPFGRETIRDASG